MFEKTVANVIAPLVKALNQLDNVRLTQEVVAIEKRERANELLDDANKASNEAEKAAKLHAKLKALLED